MNKSKLIYPKLSYLVIGICFEAHNELGRYAREKQFGDFIQRRFKEEGIKFKREVSVSNLGNRIDFLLEDKIILELKSKLRIGKSDYYQVQRYLHTTNIKLGLLVNFRRRYLQPKRILRTKKMISMY